MEMRLGAESPGDRGVDVFSYYTRLARLQAYCRVHYAEKITLERAAQVAGLERTYFSAYFSQKVGICFSTWLASLRIDEAKRRIESSDQSIGSIAADVGFQNLTTFERTFKRCTGMTAGQYRQRVRPGPPARSPQGETKSPQGGHGGDQGPTDARGS